MTELNVMNEAVRYQKTIVDNTFEILSIFQNSSNDTLQQSLEQCSWLPEETKQGYNQWINCYRSASGDLKKLIDGCYQKLEEQYAYWGDESGSPTEEKIAETPLIKTKAAGSRKISAVKTKVIAKSTGQSKEKRSSHPTGAEDCKTIPATAPRRSRKKPAAKAQIAKKQTAVKGKNSLSDSSSKAVTAGVKKEGTETPLASKQAAVPATNKLPADRSEKVTTPLVGKKESTQKSS